MMLAVIALLFVIACDKGTGKVTVSFVTQTEEVFPDEIKTVGEAYGKLPTPTREDHTFDGWYTKEEGGFEVTRDTVVTKSKDHSLYARWIADQEEAPPIYYPDKPYIPPVESSSQPEGVPPMEDLDLDVAEQKVAADTYSSYVIDEEGCLWAWGENSCGQVGDGTHTNRYTPVRIMQDKKFSFVTADNRTVHAIDTEGCLWAWGYYYDANPEQILPERKFYKVVQLAGTAFAIEQNGDLWAWGSNFGGVYGDGTFDITAIFHKKPVHVAGGTKFIDVAVYGSDHALAVDAENNLWSWGWNGSGQLGRGRFGKDDIWINGMPVDLNDYARRTPFLEKVSRVFAGPEYSFAIDMEGRLWGWGNNERGQLGNGEQSEINPTPAIISEEIEFVFFEIYDYTIYGLDKEGKVWAWGRASEYESITQTELEGCTLTPTWILPEVRCSSFAVSELHAIAYNLDGELIGWGSDENGMLATEIGADRMEIKERITDVSYTQIEIVNNTTLALDEEGKLWAWGDCTYYGNGITESGATPVPVMPEKRFKQLHTWQFGIPSTVLVIDTDGGLWGWGYNWHNVLGDSGTGHYSLPTKIQVDACFASVSFSGEHVLAIDEEGKIWAWGRNNYGQLGDRTTEDKKAPVRLETEERFQQVAAGRYFSVALDTEGKMFFLGGLWFLRARFTPCLGGKKPSFCANIGRRRARIGIGYGRQAVGLGQQQSWPARRRKNNLGAQRNCLWRSARGYAVFYYFSV